MIEGSLYNAPKNLLKSKVILVTGGGSGIGRQAGLTFAAFGAEAILLGKNSSNLNETYSLFEKNNLKNQYYKQLTLKQLKKKISKRFRKQCLKNLENWMVCLITLAF